MSKYRIMLQEYKANNKLTYNDLADKIGISKSTLERLILHQDAMPSLATAKALNSFFNIETEIPDIKTRSDIGHKLYRARTKAGLSLKALGEKLHMSPSHLCKIENGQYDPTDSFKIIIMNFIDETMTPKPKKKAEKKAPERERFGPMQNHEGYSDPTAGKAIQSITAKYTDPLPGEVWLTRRANGSVVCKLIVSQANSRCLCFSVFAKDEPMAVKIKTKNGITRYVSLTFYEALKLGDFEKRIDAVQEKYLDKIKEQLCSDLEIYAGVKTVEVEKIVEKEVPVEVEKIVEVPADSCERIKEELAMKTLEASIYKDIVYRMLGPLPATSVLREGE